MVVITIIIIIIIQYFYPTIGRNFRGGETSEAVYSLQRIMNRQLWQRTFAVTIPFFTMYKISLKHGFI